MSKPIPEWIKKKRKLLGAAVLDYRKKAGFTQEKLAEKADLSPIFISRIERGAEIPSVDNLMRIAKALGVNVHDIVSEF